MSDFSGPAIWYALDYPQAQWRHDIADGLRDTQPELATLIDQGQVYIPVDIFLDMHQLQHDPVVRFVTKRVGRQAGKTTAQEAGLWDDVWLPDDEHGSPLIWVGADEKTNADKIWGRFIAHVDQLDDTLKQHFHENKNDGVITIDAGTFQNKWPIRILRKTGENAGTWVGDPLSRARLDEAQQIPDTAITNMLPALQTRQGKMFATGVAENDHHGTTWWYLFNKRGVDPTDVEFYASAAPSWAVPWQDRVQIERDREVLGDELWSARYAAEFPTLSGAVFPVEYRERFFNHGLAFKEPDEGSGIYGAGLDVASGGDDFTVLTIGDERNRQIVFARAYPRIEPHLQQKLVAEDLHRYGNAHGLLDGTVAGIYWATDLANLQCRLAPYEMSGRGKATLIEEFRRALERELISAPAIPQLNDEMEVYQRTEHRNQYGAYGYDAPRGYHDDWVVSAALLSKQLGAGSAVRARREGTRKVMAYV